jgi:hypothetical protein
MPNHIQNIVKIKGNKEDIAKCAKTIFKGDKFSFKNIIPRPTDLEIEKSSYLGDGITLINGTEEQKERVITKFKRWANEERPLETFIEESKELGRKALENQKKYGFTDWYDWSIENWGTKWDAYEIDYDVTEDTINLNFQTAWNTPYPIFEELSRMFPNISIYVDFADEDLGCNCGEYGFEGGEAFKFDEGDLMFACEVWGYDYDEIMREREEEDEEEF